MLLWQKSGDNPVAGTSLCNQLGSLWILVYSYYAVFSFFKAENKNLVRTELLKIDMIIINFCSSIVRNTFDIKPGVSLKSFLSFSSIYLKIHSTLTKWIKFTGIVHSGYHINDSITKILWDSHYEIVYIWDQHLHVPVFASAWNRN